MSDDKLILDTDLGWVQDCDVCAGLRETIGALTQQHRAAVEAATGEAADPDSDVWGDGMVHPNEFLLVFARRQIHEGKTGHVAFGWRWVREARTIAKKFADDPDNQFAAFWSDFMDRFLKLPVMDGAQVEEVGNENGR